MYPVFNVDAGKLTLTQNLMQGMMASFVLGSGLAYLG